MRYRLLFMPLLLLTTWSRAELFDCTQNAFATRDYTVFGNQNKWCAGVKCPDEGLFQTTPTSSFKNLEHRKYLLSIDQKTRPSIKIIRSISEEGETSTEDIKPRIISRDPKSGAIIMSYASEMGNQLFSIILSPQLKKLVVTEVFFVQGVGGRFRTFDCQ